MRITSAGNVGIGTSSPNANGFSTALTINGSGTSALELTVGGVNQGYIGSNTSNVFLVARTNIPITFYTNDTERMRITSGGEVGIGGTPASNFKFYIKGIDATSSNFGIVVADSSNVTNLYVMNNGTGYLRAAAWAYGSDKRIKENINYIESGIEKVMALKPATFDYIDGVKNNIGWIAQDVKEVIPEAVSTISETNDQLTLKSDFIVPYLVAAIQEQQSQIEELKQLIKNK
jgi:hypothetical protein